MSFPHPPPARRGLMRWLLLLVVLAGLGLLQSGHCDDMPVTAISPTPADSAVSHDSAAPISTGVGSGSALTPSLNHRHDLAGLPHPATTVEQCQPLVSTVPASVGVTAVPLPLVLRTSIIPIRPTISAGRVLPAVALAALGVLRT